MEQPSIPLAFGAVLLCVYNGYAFVWLNKKLVYGTSSPIELSCKVGEVANPLRWPQQRLHDSAT
jgi:hypothetical protein